MDSTLVQPLVSKKAARLSIGAFFFIAGLCFASWASRIPDIKQQLQLSDGGLGAVLLALPVGLMVSLPFSGWLVHHFGSRKMVLLAAILYPLVLCNIGLVQQTWQLVVVLFAFGLLGNLFNISVNTQAVSLEVLYGRSIMASFHGIWSLAGFTGASIGTLMINFHLAPFTHFCTIAATAYLMVALLYRNSLRQDINADGDRPLFARPDATLLKLGLIAMCCMVCEGAMFDWSGVYFQKVVAVSKGLIPLGYTAFMCTMAGGRFAGDKLVTRLGTLRMLQFSGLVIATGLAIAIIFPTLVTATLGFMLVGIGVSSVVPLVYGVAGKSTVFSPGVALAAVSTIGYLGFLAGPPMIGFIAQAASLRLSFAVIAVLGFTTTIISTKTKF
ncbi:MFS transporter [Niastella koreensis]|uniref:Major facilitator superfamily MFS_1 n=2 Tax=Niastella koreensis TaxID=354356 RepID=G8TH37_NIAKG|nr:MFS transporter [Niastella koreensis]AEW00648.1 major facilitator superfamily MFS_1 [Niastella koreensis GR20-10]OQP42280.1 MFS transporter [Niastella koreensis]